MFACLFLLIVGNHEYKFVGVGVADSSGRSHIWNVGNAKGQGVGACYEAVKLDERCAKDYFTYSTRGDKNCGCKTSIDALVILLDTQDNKKGDIFKTKSMHEFKNILREKIHLKYYCCNRTSSKYLFYNY